MKRKKFLSILLVLAILLSSFHLGFAAELDSLTKYDMNIILKDKDRIVEGEQTVKFTNTYNTDLKELVFHLYPDAYNSYETMPAIGGMFHMEGREITEEEKGYIKIHKVYIDEKEAQYTDDNQILKIKMEEPIKTGKEVDIKIKFTLKVPEGNHRLHHLGGTYSLTNWYPILSIYDENTKKWDENPYHPIGESNYSDVSNYNVKLTVPKNMVVAPTGSIVDEKEDGDNKTITIKAEKVRDFVILMSHAYKVKTKEVDGIKISNYYMDDKDYPRDNKSVDKVLDEVAKTVKFMNKTVGKYPYDELRIAETFLGGGAMEYPQVIQMGRYMDLSQVDIKERAPFTIEAAVHETMHQWWYVGVGNNEFKEPFLDESLTVFMTAYYFEKEYGKYHENGVSYRIRKSIYPSNILPLNSSVDDFNDWGDYSETIYTRGPAFFEDLRQRVGEEKFIKILQTYYERYQFKNATIDGLLDVIEKIAGKEIGNVMKKAVTEPNYYPKDIELTQEERANYYRNQEKRHLKMVEEDRGLIIGSIILRALEGEDVIIVKPDYIKEEDSAGIEHFIRRLTEDSSFEFDNEMKVVEEKKITEKDKKGNLILIGYPDKNSIMKEMASNLPIRIDSDIISINGVYIKNENISGSFILENPNNSKKLILIIFLDENKDVKEEPKEGEYILFNNTIHKYNPMYQSYDQFMIDVNDIEIKGMYK